ncbi:hypothetical protein [Paenibacillus vulneris]|uniref:Uncharacterized protein n=1 Tax=Paenibacillus vulneris TaxID=1133364 RepID=A0ABW3ULI6_9BACL
MNKGKGGVGCDSCAVFPAGIPLMIGGRRAAGWSLSSKIAP